MKILLLLLTFLVTTPQPDCLKVDIILVGDFSGSVGGYEKFVTDAFTAFIDKFNLSEEGVKIGMVYFDESAYLISPLTNNKDTLRNRFDNSNPIAGGDTNLKDALMVSFNELTENGRQGYKRIIILISDGDAQDKEGAEIIARQVKSTGVMICGVLIVSGFSQNEYMKQVSSEFCYVETSYENLIEELRKLDICL